jgi:ferredoxin
MFAPFEIRNGDAGVCYQCRTKDCYRGNEQFYGCPVFECMGGGTESQWIFNAGSIDSNRDCILCTECIKACPQGNVTLKLRMWGHDLWARSKARLDESAAAVILAAMVTMVALLLVLFLPRVYLGMRSVLPAGIPPNDWPRLASIAMIYLCGIALALLLFYGFSYLSRRFSGIKGTKTSTIFTHFGYALVPLAVMKFLSDIVDHVLRTWGAITDVTRALMLDFPFNRIAPTTVTVKQLLSADQTYLVQMGLIGIGAGFGFYVALKLAGRLSSDRAAALRAFLPIAAFIFIMTMTAVWALSAAL